MEEAEEQNRFDTEIELIPADLLSTLACREEALSRGEVLTHAEVEAQMRRRWCGNND